MTSATESLRVGFVPGVILTKWRRVWEERFPAVALEPAEVALADQRRLLLDGTLDMCFVRRPIEQEGLHIIPLYDEVVVAWAAKEHPVAAFDEITLADLADERVLDDADQVSIDAAVAEVAVLRVPMSIARTHNRRDLVYRPIVDAPPSSVGLAWLRDNDSPWIEEFIGVVRGRTVNSSRTAAERSTQPTKAPAPRPAKPKPKPARPTGKRRR
ncbi:MAG: LysR family substrate-binding domain-containing protein [Arachnia sp.]